MDVITLLCKAGADLLITDNDGETALDVAQDKRTKKKIEQLMEESDNKEEEDSKGEDTEESEGDAAS